MNPPAIEQSLNRIDQLLKGRTLKDILSTNAQQQQAQQQQNTSVIISKPSIIHSNPLINNITTTTTTMTPNLNNIPTQSITLHPIVDNKPLTQTTSIVNQNQYSAQPVQNILLNKVKSKKKAVETLQMTKKEREEYEREKKRRKEERKKKKITFRVAGGEMWEDPSLEDWDVNDFRCFCGNLGNEVTDEILASAFRKYPSFKKARVIRDKKTSKTKGYGFVSLGNFEDFKKAIKEMNGVYVGNRPIKLSRSDWKDRSVSENLNKLHDVKFKKKKKF